MPHPLALLLPALAFAAEPSGPLFEGLTVSKVFRHVTITHYSATPDDGPICDRENEQGGPDGSPSGFRPLSHRLGNPGRIYGRPAILAAVPREGGTRPAYKCYFALPDAYPGKLFFGGDFYGPESNYEMKTDVSSPCTSVVDQTLYSKMIIYDCGAQAARVGPLMGKTIIAANKPKPEERPAVVAQPKRPQKPAGECLWYAVASCDRNRANLLNDQESLGNDFEIIRTDSVPTFSKGWYCLVSGTQEHASAAAKVSRAKRRVNSAYLKKGC